MKALLCWFGRLFLACWLAHAVPGMAQQEEFTGLVIDQTISKFGHDFYDFFMAGWEPPNDAFILTIKERPSLVLGSLIWIEIDDTVVYESLLTPKLSANEEKAQDARNYALEYISYRGKALQELDLF